MSAAYTAPVICLFTPCVQQPHAAELLLMTLYLVMVLYLAKALDSRSEVQPPALQTKLNKSGGADTTLRLVPLAGALLNALLLSLETPTV